MACLRSTTIGARCPPQASAETETFSTASLTLCCTSAAMRVITIPSDVRSTRAVRVFRMKFMADHYGCFAEKFVWDESQLSLPRVGVGPLKKVLLELFYAHEDASSESSLSCPVLSPSFSVGTPRLASNVSCRFASGVCSG